MFEFEVIQGLKPNDEILEFWNFIKNFWKLACKSVFYLGNIWENKKIINFFQN